MSIKIPKIRKSFVEAIKILNKRGKAGYEFFDYPEYGGLPKRISNILISDEVDYIQDNWDELKD